MTTFPSLQSLGGGWDLEWKPHRRGAGNCAARERSAWGSVGVSCSRETATTASPVTTVVLPAQGRCSWWCKACVLFRAWHTAGAQTMLGERHWPLLIFADVSSGEGNPLGGEAWMCAGLFSLVLRSKPGPRSAAGMRQRSAHHKEGLSD